MPFLPPNQQRQSTEGFSLIQAYMQYYDIHWSHAFLVHQLTLCHSVIIFVVILVLMPSVLCLQCFDAVGWVAGRAFGL